VEHADERLARAEEILEWHASRASPFEAYE
jgi:hypothetical protein